jgi:hypothetical protein
LIPASPPPRWTLKEGVPELPGFHSETYQSTGQRQKPRQAYTNLEPEAWEGWKAACVSRRTYFRRLKAAEVALQSTLT